MGQIVNLMEEFIEHAYQELIHEKGDTLCTCNTCHIDTIAYALNRLPPRYTSSHKGEAYSKSDYNLNLQYNIDVKAAVIRAIIVIQNNRHHDAI